MTASDLRFWTRVHRRIAGLQADAQRALLSAYRIIRASLSEAELSRIIESGNLDLLFAGPLSAAVMDRAFLPFRNEIRKIVERAFRYTTPELPKAGRVNGVPAVSLDHLDPDVANAIRTLEVGILAAVTGAVALGVREAIRMGREAGRAPRTIARDVPGIIGLGPTQVKEAAKYRDTVAEKPSLSPAQIDRQTEAYQKQRITQNVEATSQKATRQSYSTGQSLAWKDALSAGFVSGDRLVKTWLQIDRPSKRLSHARMNGITVPFDEPYPNGQTIPGEDPEDYGCGCVSKILIIRGGVERTPTSEELSRLTSGRFSA